jgi:hypothetical protein
MRWFWNAELRPVPQDRHALQLGGTFYADTLSDVLMQVTRAVQDDWQAVPLYDGRPLELHVKIQTEGVTK